MTQAPEQPEVAWHGWAVDVPGQRLYVGCGGDEASAWHHALGWPDDGEIAEAKARGARAFPIQIVERRK